MNFRLCGSWQWHWHLLRLHSLCRLPRTLPCHGSPHSLSHHRGFPHWLPRSLAPHCCNSQLPSLHGGEFPQRQRPNLSQYQLQNLFHYSYIVLNKKWKELPSIVFKAIVDTVVLFGRLSVEPRCDVDDMLLWRLWYRSYIITIEIEGVKIVISATEYTPDHQTCLAIVDADVLVVGLLLFLRKRKRQIV